MKLQKVHQVAADRKKYNDRENFHALERIQDTDFDEITKKLRQKLQRLMQRLQDQWKN